MVDKKTIIIIVLICIVTGLGLTVFFLFPRSVTAEPVSARFNGANLEAVVDIKSDNFINLPVKRAVGNVYSNSVLVGTGVLEDTVIQKRSVTRVVFPFDFVVACSSGSAYKFKMDFDLKILFVSFTISREFSRTVYC